VSDVSVSSFPDPHILTGIPIHDHPHNDPENHTIFNSQSQPNPMKPHTNSFIRFSSILAVVAIVSATYTHAADLTWNGATNNNWNTTDANWTGSTWTAGDNAIFNTSTGAISLTEPISAGSFTFGDFSAAGNITGSFSGSSLTISGDLTAVAYGNNGSGGPVISFSNNVTVTGDLKVGRRVVEITGGTFTANRLLSAGSWGRLLISGGNVTMTNGIDDSINGGNTMSVILFGGTLSTPFIKTTSAGFTGLPEDGVVLSGGTLIATANSTDFIQTYQAPFNWGDRNNVGVGPAGANINTNGFDITINKTLQNYGGAGTLTKDGAGKLTLVWSEHSGGTTVNAGTLEYAANSGYSLLRNVLTVNAGGTVSVLGDGTGLGYQGGSKVETLNIVGGTVTSPGTMHVWNIGGGVNMTGGTLQSNNGVSNANGPQLEWINSNVTTNASADTATIGGRIRMRADGGAPGITFIVADGAAATDLLVSAAITEASGGRSITKTGAGTMVLSGANNYTGTTTVSEGVLSLSSPTLDDVAAVVIGNDGKMDLNFAGSDTVGSLEIAGSGLLPAGVYNSTHPTYGTYFTGTGSLVIAGANGSWASLVDGNWSDASNWTANTIATGYDATATFNAATGVTVTSDANRKIGNLAFSVSDYTISGPGVLSLDASTTPSISVSSGRIATIASSLIGTLGMEKTGAGTLVFNGVKGYAGGTTVTGGTLELAGGTAGNSIIGGSLFINPGTAVNLTSGDGSGFGWNNPVTSITVDGGTLNAVGGSHIGFGSNATLTLDNGASVLGNWQWNGSGFLTVSSYGNTANTISGNLNLRADAGSSHPFFVDDGTAAVDLQVNANLSDQWPEVWWVPASGLTKNGPGTMVLNGTNSFDGNTVINEGALEVSASSSLHFYPTTNGTTNSVSGSGSGSLSFLGTVSLNLSAANTTGGNVWNLFNLGSFAVAPSLSGTAGVTSNLGAFSEVSAGTWELPVTGAKWVFTEADGNLAYVITATDYDNWETANGVTGGENDDDDNDGLTNFEEYAFGTDPTGGSEVNPITIPLDKATGTFSYTRRQQSLTGLSYSIWTSTDLGIWTQDSGAIQGTPVVTGEVETVPVTLSSALLTNSKLFIQVRAD
jgi:fibronectin-binding autotransporter adhesin